MIFYFNLNVMAKLNFSGANTEKKCLISVDTFNILWKQ